MIQKISATKLETYLNCPYSYYIKYVMRKADEEEKTPSMYFGIFIHSILDDFHKWIKNNSLPFDINEMKTVVYNRVIAIINENIKRYRKTLPKNINPHKVFVNNIQPYLKNFFFRNKLYLKNFESELEFNIPIWEIANGMPKSLLSPLINRYKNIVITGKIDLIVFPNIIVDFKVQSKKFFKKSFAKNFQSIIYTLIYPRDMTFIYIFLKPYNTVYVKLSEETRVFKLNYILNILYKIENDLIFKRKNKCKTCIFRRYCKA